MAGDDSVPGVLVCHPCGCHVPPRPATSLVLGLSRITRHRLVSEMSRCIRASGIGRRAKGFSFACWRFANGALGSGSWNFGGDRREDVVEILGQHGAIRFSMFDDVPLQCRTGDEVQSVFIANPSPIQRWAQASRPS